MAKAKQSRARPPTLDDIPEDARGLALSLETAAKLAMRGSAKVEFTDLADVALFAAASPLCKESVRLQWLRAAMDNIYRHKEEQRLLNGIGAETEFSIVVKPPPLFAKEDLDATKQPEDPAPEPAGDTVH